MMIRSVLKLVGGQLAPDTRTGPTIPVASAMQREAVVFLVDEAPAAYDALLRPGALARGDPVGGALLVDRRRAQWVGSLLAGPKLAQLEAQQSLAEDTYGTLDLLRDVTERIWGDLESPPAWRAAQQEAWLDAAARVLDPKPDTAAAQRAAALAALLYSPGYIAVQLSDGSDTAFPGFAREVLPGIGERVRRAASRSSDPAQKAHLEQVAARIAALLEA